jgi:hypothetical protein
MQRFAVPQRYGHRDTRARRIHSDFRASVTLWTILRILSLLLVVALSGQGSAVAHKIHVSVAQLEYNPRLQNVEVVLRVYADDLENALSRHARRPIKLDPEKDKEAGEVVMGYLRQHFELKNSAGKPVRFAWVGIESQVDMFWLYFQGKLPAGLSGTQLKNRVFCDLFEDQVNIVNTKLSGKPLGLMFEPKDEFKPILTK